MDRRKLKTAWKPAIRKGKEPEAPKKREKRGKKLRAAAAAMVVAAGVGVNRSFTAREIVQGPESAPAVEQFEPTLDTGGDVLAQLPDSEQMSPADRRRSWFLHLPVGVRAACLLPLWALGSLPSALFTALGPVWSALLGLALQAGLLTGLFCLVYKLLFPDHKVRELFRRKNLKWLLLAAVAVTAADVLLAQLWTGWPVVRVLVMLAVGFGVLWLLWRRLCGALHAPEPETVKNRLVLEKTA